MIGRVRPTLFLRIFLWFWLAMAVAVAVWVITSPYWTRVRPQIAQWEQQVFSGLVRRAEAVTMTISREGVAALPGSGEGNRARGRGRGRPGRRGLQRGPGRLFLFNSDGSVSGDRDPPPAARALARRVAESGEPELAREDSLFLSGQPVVDPEGNELITVLAARPQHGLDDRPRATDLVRPEVLLPRLLVVVIVVGGFCYSLARYLTSPVSTMRLATRRLAAGDLSVRVGGAIGSRRDEIGDLARDFDAMAERVQTLIGSQQRLLRDVSHELRSPLARLTVALELARQRAGEKAGKPLARIELEAQRLNALIEHLLTLTRLEASDEVKASGPVDLGALLDEIVADAEFEARARGCTVRLTVQAPAVVDGVTDLLRSAFENVIRNGTRYTAEGSQVTVGLTAFDADAVVTVCDHGPGVPPAELANLFQPFYRVADARDRATGGTGLGLAITARALELHRGSVEARNLPAGGLEVEMRLPLARERLAVSD